LILAIPWFTPAPDVGRLIAAIEGGEARAGGRRPTWRRPCRSAQRRPTRDPATAHRLIALARQETQVAAPDEDQVRCKSVCAGYWASWKRPSRWSCSPTWPGESERRPPGGHGIRSPCLAGRLGSRRRRPAAAAHQCLVETSRRAIRGFAARPLVLGVLGAQTPFRGSRTAGRPAAEVRDNAAIGLAGRAMRRVSAVLVEMLSAADIRWKCSPGAASGAPPGGPSAKQPAKQSTSDIQRMQREMVVINALRRPTSWAS